jgi:hypothetical protein
MFVVGFALTALSTALIGKRLMRVVRLRETLIRAGVWFFVGFLGSFAAWLHLRFFDPMFLREGSAENYKRRFAHDAAREKHAAVKHEHMMPPQPKDEHVFKDDSTPDVPHPQQAPAAHEVVGAGGEVLPRTPSDAAGNGHAKEPSPESFPESIDIKDPDERQN